MGFVRSGLGLVAFALLSGCQNISGIRGAGIISFNPAPSPSPLPPAYTDYKPWSDPASWPSGVVPVAGDTVVISAGMKILLDTDTPPLNEVHLSGELKGDLTRDIGITANLIHIMGPGVFQIGEPQARYSRRAKIKLTGARPAHSARSGIDNALDNSGNVRALHVMGGGTLALYGAVPAFARTQLNAHAPAGATTLTVEDAVGWRAGDRIAISTTDFHGIGTTEVHTLAQDSSGTTLYLSQPLATSRWGRLQYPRDAVSNGSAMSLVQGAFTPAHPTTPAVLDERARVLNLSRSIVVEGADAGETSWTAAGSDLGSGGGFGGHTMVMGLSSKFRVDGVLFHRMGQRRAMGRYPIHWHMLSYRPDNENPAGPIAPGAGTYLGDANPDDHFLKNSVILESQNRAVTIHGTNGVLVERNFAVDIQGHAFFMEDGVEQNNVIDRNVAMKVQAPAPSVRMKAHDEDAAGFWITNPVNRVIGNEASDARIGVWNSFANQAFGLSRRVVMTTSSLFVLEHRGNIAHGNARFGIMTENIVFNEAGSVGPNRYDPRSSTGVRGPVFFLENQTWKNREGGYLNRIHEPIYERWVAADNDTIDFTGQTLFGAIRDTLFVAQSLNNANGFQHPRKRGVASYHFSVNIVRPTALNYPAPLPSPYMTADRQFVYNNGFFDGRDLYIDSVGLGMFRNYGWKLINSHPGYIAPSTAMDGMPNPSVVGGGSWYGNWANAGAVGDFYGYWGFPRSWLVPNFPFYTFGLSPSEIYDTTVPSIVHSGRIAVSRKFIGVGGLSVTGSSNPFHIRANRLDPGAGFGLVPGAEHDIPEQTTWLSGARHFSFANQGAYLVSFPDRAQAPGSIAGDRVGLTFQGATDTDVSVIVAVPWGGASAQARILLGSSVARSFTQASSLSAFVADTTGTLMYHDVGAQRVYARIRGGVMGSSWLPSQADWNCMGQSGINHPLPLPATVDTSNLFNLLFGWASQSWFNPERVGDGCIYMPFDLEVRAP